MIETSPKHSCESGWGDDESNSARINALPSNHLVTCALSAVLDRLETEPGRMATDACPASKAYVRTRREATHAPTTQAYATSTTAASAPSRTSAVRRADAPTSGEASRVPARVARSAVASASVEQCKELLTDSEGPLDLVNAQAVRWMGDGVASEPDGVNFILKNRNPAFDGRKGVGSERFVGWQPLDDLSLAWRQREVAPFRRWRSQPPSERC